MYDTSRTLMDPCVSGRQKALAASLFVAGLVLPGGGYSKADDVGGFIYRRINPVTGEHYIGQSKSMKRYIERQAEHNRALGVQHEYEVLGNAAPGRDLDVLEETMIRQNGGIQKRGGTLANKRHQMSEKRYRAAGGTTDLPYD
ncbi:hypothetical protein [Pseudoxanthomonas sp. UC19_8]|uniref:hypothetical protein n=1 Tax=Pseudoxanthomonas sp. UC19_8 TaxID=3350175 RepID=UPI0036D3AB2D